MEWWIRLRWQEYHVDIIKYKVSRTRIIDCRINDDLIFYNPLSIYCLQHYLDLLGNNSLESLLKVPALLSGQLPRTVEAPARFSASL